MKPLFAVCCNPRVSKREAEALIIDCTEQPVEQPQDNATQEAHYSGKKKRYTLKTEYIVSAEGRVVSVSASHPGSRRDLSIRRAGPPLPKRAHGYADSAYQGYGKDHPNLDVPCKKPKGGELTQEKKDYNRALGSFRIAVEHRIGRNPRDTHHTKTSAIAGLVNLQAGFAPCSGHTGKVDRLTRKLRQLSQQV